MLYQVITMSSSVTATRTDTTDSRTTSIAILICGRHNNASVSKGGGGSGSDEKKIPLVVWAQQQRIRQSPDDPWKYTLHYFELEDDSR